jgi:hypothetical protein
MPLPDVPIPLRLSRRQFWLGAGVLGLFGIVVIVGSPLCRFVDFSQFWAAGRTVGTPDLFDGDRRVAWEQAHGLGLGWWVYPPGAAWLFVPFSIWPLPVGFWLHAAFMAGCVAASGILGARIYGLDRRVGVLMAFAWTPDMASAIVGQNAALGLILSLIAIEGLRRGNDGLAGLGVGLLLYKPTLALPLIGLLVLRLRWRALLVVAGCAGAWYLAGVAGAAGDWSWPGRWLSYLGDYYEGDTTFNIVRMISTPGVLQGLGVPSVVALSVGAVMVVLAVPRLIRAPIVEAGAGAMLVGVAASPHALNYEGALILPALLWALGGSGTGIREPARTRLVVTACIIAPEYLCSETVGLSILAAIAFIGAVVWIFGLWRAETGREPERQRPGLSGTPRPPPPQAPGP